MDEPMEDMQPDSTQESQSSETTRKACAPLLRPGSMVMMTLTPEDYQNEYWPKLQGAIAQLLTMDPGSYIPISYEQMYSCVYKCVCKQFSERLYSDLLALMTSHVQMLNTQLEGNMEDSKKFIECFSYTMHQYLQALAVIVPIFNYMNRFYVENKLKKDLNEELRRLFRIHVADHHINNLLPLLEEVSCQPFAIAPPVMANLMRNLHSLNSEYVRLKPALFAKFIPSVLPPTSVTDLEKYIDEVQQMQRDIHLLPDFAHHDQSRKRGCEEDISVN
ncbi:CDK2-associated and cullin domain-containing protein 1-like [Haliotis cracherodii]|uniref:CDK2-associated and cullin domain-containing protein 1-like n=1 Tax=Haliotis rufescens TaxID=6454 RepID=UPI001EB09CCF|nr:CDK2-associated and cullin domain-containing protein 1-like [Haliotis rufescens]